MFNLDEALRNHLAQRQKEPKARFVAATVATLSPRSKPGRTRVVAAVAAVATSLAMAHDRFTLTLGTSLRSIETMGNH